MRFPSPGRWRPRFRIRTLMAVVIVTAFVLAVPMIAVEPYRRDALRERQAIEQIRSEMPGRSIYFKTTRVGPKWLHVLAGPSRLHHFDRVERIFVVAASLEPVSSRQEEFKHLKMVFGD